MSAGYQHELDAKLASANMFAWFGPMFQLLVRHWPITFGAGVAALIVQGVVARLPWPLLPSWWMTMFHTFVESLALTLVVVAGYRVLAEKESAGTALGVNEWPATMIAALQICAVWTIGGSLVGWGLLLAGKAIVALLPNMGSGGGVILVLLIYGALAIPIVVFLLSPVWVTLSVAGALSTVHAARSLENGIGAVLASLHHAFDQKWRVFWPSYALGLLAIVVYALAAYLSFGSLGSFGLGEWFVDVVAVAFTAMAVAMTFVLERAYTPDLGLIWEDDGREPSAAPSAPGPAAAAQAGPRDAAAMRAVAATRGSAATRGGAATRERAATPDGAATPVAAEDIAAAIEQDLRANRTQRLVELVERGLAVSPQFFTGHPDSTIALAKRIAAAQRTDLALRVLQQYLKDHRGHRLHLTGALLVGNLLLRDGRRLPDAARFLERVKALYPTEPMVDQLIKATNKALAELAG